jgi:hypothetical protein
LNIHGAKKKTVDLQHLLQSKRVDVMALQETLLRSTASPSPTISASPHSDTPQLPAAVYQFSSDPGLPEKLLDPPTPTGFSSGYPDRRFRPRLSLAAFTCRTAQQADRPRRNWPRIWYASLMGTQTRPWC